MVYFSRGLGPVNGYDTYFGPDVDNDALLYMALANELLHELRPDIITIAEEVTGLATLCRPVKEGILYTRISSSFLITLSLLFNYLFFIVYPSCFVLLILI